MQFHERNEDSEGKEMKLTERMDYRTVGVVYSMWCKKYKKMVYVEKRKNRFMERFNGH